MIELPFVHVDAFADRPFTGGPAAVVRLDRPLADEQLQMIAAEINLPATAFANSAQDDTDYELIWFSPTSELGLCGHASLAAGHVLMTGDTIRFATRKAGPIEVSRHGDGYALSLPARKPEPRPLAQIAAELGARPVETLWHGERYAVIVLASEEEVLALEPDFAALGAHGNIQLIVTAPGESADIVTRVFLPSGGGHEDPVTGSAHAVIVPYWAERLGRSEFSAWQASSRGARLHCRLDGGRVILGGRCVTVISGTIRI